MYYLSMSNIKSYTEQVLSELVEAAKEGIATLIADVKRPIADDVADERRKSALESKKKAFMDAQEMITALVKLDKQINSDEDLDDEVSNENSFKGGFSEKFAKKKYL
jgi:antitoxin (DNA-binding transcriptional repressor) of toxin-antitoxin stability system